ncbi:hypothetical protein BC830DRAFT_1109813 [Chytriomyces sp. MP71]|nr:hypothetical protein BC830DRAFT_1109813 [Chytriomyces sp. MP71]
MSPFNASSTAAQVSEAFKDQCAGRVVIVTGANTGLGLETATTLSAHGATVILTSRSKQNGERAVVSIKKLYPSAKVSSAELDLASLASVSAFATNFTAAHAHLHILINNAGVMACDQGTTQDGFETQFGVNHLGHFHLTSLLLPLLLASATPDCPARVVNLSSFGGYLYAPPEGIPFDDLDARGSYNAWTRYGVSKLANILHAKELQCRYGERGLCAVSLHPGVILGTKLARHTGLASALDTIWKIVVKPGALWTVLGERSKSIAEGAATTVLAALDPTIEGGAFYYDCIKSAGEKMHPQSDNAELAAKLWDASEELVAKALGRGG